MKVKLRIDLINCHFIVLLCFHLLLLSACKKDDQRTSATQQSITEDTLISIHIPDTFPAIPEDTASLQKKTDKLNEALSLYRADSTSLDNIIWYARRLGYLHRYREAIVVLTRGIHIHPRAPELYRHRGHRLITIRDFDAAIHDLQHAVDLVRELPLTPEPDGIPNKLDIPLSNLHFNIYYHLALAYYLKGDYTNAAAQWATCMKYAVNPDLKVATTAWHFTVLMRMSDSTSARALLEPIHPHMEIIENEAYLQVLLLHKGLLTPDQLIPNPDSLQANEVAQAYGLSCYLEQQGRQAEANTLRQNILATGQWPTFGYIAAEADLININR
jgi:tetratricopeptide (TPR) repeat protein